MSDFPLDSSGSSGSSGSSKPTVMDATLVEDSVSSDLAVQEEEQTDLIVLVESIAKAYAPTW